MALLGTSCAAVSPLVEDKSSAVQATLGKGLQQGFIDFRWDEASGKIFLHVSQLESPFIYQTSLARGIGSNDIGADRGQLGSTKLVEFFRSGNKLLLIENNTDYRAVSDNPDEQLAIEESFARSVLWGFTIDNDSDDVLVVDATDFLLRDSLSLDRWLADMEQGSFSVDASRSAIYLPRTKAFPDNTEFEAILTLTGAPEGDILPTVVPDSTAVTVHTHHSFVRLPEPGYEPLPYDPRAGYIDPSWGGSFSDYAVAIDEPVKKSYARRHRLKKRNPEAEISEAVEPIVYYLDRGAPEPVRSALLDGARWWNQAYEAAGYKDAFRIEMLPVGADPLDVRYNVIQWVHRSTRGWSYGASIVDPRTSEILKGHVSLGSLRVRQDYLLAEGLLAPYGSDIHNPAMEAFALARIRQLSAHEIGHTLGLEHNFAGSVNNRASVMDYPFPLVTLDDEGRVDISNAYAEGIGEWDKRAIMWGYQDFPDGVDAQAARAEILNQTLRSGLKYVADNDSRSISSAHIDGNLWDNGADPVDELVRLMRVRERVMQNFSAANLPKDRPMATLEEVLVPMYLLHRYQLQAAGKVLGGGYYKYDLKGDGQAGFIAAPSNQQKRALDVLLQTLSPSVLLLPDKVSELISPRPPGFSRGRETFARKTGQSFDRYAPADAAIKLTLDVVLNPVRAERLIAQEASGNSLGLSELLRQLLDVSINAPQASGPVGEVQRRLNAQVIGRLISLANSPEVTDSVRGVALATLATIERSLVHARAGGQSLWQAHTLLMLQQVEFALRDVPQPPPLMVPTPPPGSPIG